MSPMPLHVRAPDGLRLGYSPLWECVAAFLTLNKATPGVHKPWVEMVQPQGDAARSPILRRLLLTESGYIPDFVAPPPRQPLPSFEDELNELGTTSSGVVLDELKAAYPSGLPEPLATLARDPQQLLMEVTGSLAAFWAAFVLPHWPRVRAVLEREISFRSREQALRGTAALIQGLHPAVRAHDAVLRQAGAALRGTSSRRSGGLLIVPSVFGWPDAFVVSSPAWQLTLAYPARGVQQMWDARRPPTSVGLAALFGATTGRLLLSLRAPATTQDLAAILDVTPGAVSQHLQRLHRAGLLTRDRAGVRVWYGLSQRGARVLDALGHPDTGPDDRS